jgi:hypothetical protein
MTIYQVFQKDYESPLLMESFENNNLATNYMNKLNLICDNYFIREINVSNTDKKVYIKIYAMLDEYTNEVVSDSWVMTEYDKTDTSIENDDTKFYYEEIKEINSNFNLQLEIDNLINKCRNKSNGYKYLLKTDIGFISAAELIDKYKNVMESGNSNIIYLDKNNNKIEIQESKLYELDNKGNVKSIYNESGVMGF